MTRVAVMDHAVLDLDRGGSVGEENAPVWFGRWNVDVAKVRTSLVVKRNPDLQAFHLQIPEIDIALQVQRIKIFDLDRRQQSVDLSETLACLRVVEFDTLHLDSVGREVSVKVVNLGANAVVGERILDLARDVAIDKTQPEQKQDQQDYQQRAGADDHGRQNGMTAREITPTLTYGRLLLCTHNLTATARFGER